MTERLVDTSKLSRISGRIENYNCVREEASFVFSDTDRVALGVVAIAAGVAGLSGQAIATASHAGATEEPADYVSFTIEGRRVQGWVWRSPFSEGDTVDVVGAWGTDHFELVAIRRGSDRTIALYPHCTRGRHRHVANAAFWWVISASAFNGAVVLTMIGSYGWASFLDTVHDGAGYVVLGVYLFFAIATIGMTWKWMPFARLSERVFRALDIPAPGSVDLVRRTRTVRSPSDPGELGAFYFKY